MCSMEELIYSLLWVGSGVTETLGCLWADEDLLGGRCTMDAFGSYIQNYW